MKQATPARDAVIHLGNDFMMLQNIKPVVDDGAPDLVDTPPPIISDTPPSPTRDQSNIRYEPDSDELNDATVDA